MQRLCKLLGKHRRSTPIKYLARKCYHFLECYENVRNYDFDKNGERFVLDTLAGKEIQCIFDVGANIGDWALMATSIFPAAKIHSFEVLESTATILKQRTEARSNIITNNFGLSDKEGDVDLKCFSGHNVLTSMVDIPHDIPSTMTTGHVTTGDSYIDIHDIDHIDFVKIDVEGVEGQVLKGLEAAIQRGAIDVIQFEFSSATIQMKFLLEDFYDLLVPAGYALGKIYPCHVEFRDYDFQQERFFGPNYIAVRTARKDLIDKLS